MRERRAQIVLLVRAFEEADRGGTLIPVHERIGATRKALMVTGQANASEVDADLHPIRTEEAVQRRATSLYNVWIRQRIPEIRGVLTVTRLTTGLGPVVFWTALLVGAATNLLGPARHINLLSFPLLAMLAWNLAVYVVGAGAWAARAMSARPDEASSPAPDDDGHRPEVDGVVAEGRRGSAEHLAGGFLRWVQTRREKRLRGAGPLGPEAQRIAARAIRGFLGTWYQRTAGLQAARVRRVFHMGAAVLILAAVAGMYVRGVAFEYRAMWESTLLDAAAVQQLLDAVLGPASRILSTAVPDVAPLQGPDPVGGGGDAAPWIHLYALTAVLFVAIPRTLLAAFETVRIRRLAADIPIDLHDAYFRRVFSAWRGDRTRVEIVPYSFRPQGPHLDALRTLFHEYFGARAEVAVLPAVDYGAAVENAHAEQDPPDRCVVTLFNAAQPPEVEVHGAWVADVRASLAPDRDRMLVLVDRSGYRDGVADPDRLRERTAAWSRVVRDAGVTAVEVDLDRLATPPTIPDDDDLLGEIADALYPPATEAS